MPTFANSLISILHHKTDSKRASLDAAAKWFNYDQNLGNNSKIPVLVLDVDGTLYDDSCYIEQQIRDNCHEFAKKYFNLTSEESQRMYLQYGSTIRGIAEEITGNNTVFLDYYNEVYPHLDKSRLGKYAGCGSSSSCGETGSVLEDTNRGYNFFSMQAAHQVLHHLPFPIVIASNSPVFHVKRVLTRIGLANLSVDSFLTPERLGGFTKTEEGFWKPLLAMYPTDKYQCVLLDDNLLNLQLAKTLGIEGIRVTSKPSNDATKGVTFEEAIAAFIANPLHPQPFAIDAVQYLKEKNEVDALSFNAEVENKLRMKLFSKSTNHVLLQGVRDGSVSDTLRVLDIGAGLLDFLARFESWMREDMHATNKDSRSVKLVEYTALESNSDLFHAIKQKLLSRGFRTLDSIVDPGSIASMHFSKKLTSPEVEIHVHVLALDFMFPEAKQILNTLLHNPTSHVGNESKAASIGFDLIVGQCVADLHNPKQFVAQIMEFSADQGGLLYLPITFVGETTLEVIQSEDIRSRPKTRKGWFSRWFLKRTPEDTSSFTLANKISILEGASTIFHSYHRHLVSTGHYLQPTELVHAIESAQGKLLTPLRSSNWKIRKGSSPYFWKSMLWFILKGTVFDLLSQNKIDVASWIQLIDKHASNLQLVASNVDILAELPIIDQYISPHLSKNSSLIEHVFSEHTSGNQLRQTPPYHLSAEDSVSSVQNKVKLRNRKFVEFQGPCNVTVSEEADPLFVSHIQPNEVYIETKFSLISTGTELKIYRGSVVNSEDDEPLDTTIASMKDSRIQYPIRYGYSLVGRITRVGVSLDAGKYLNKRVFAFAPHGTSSIVRGSDVHFIPDDISDEDAVFLPSMETAISLIMATDLGPMSPMVGERVAVVGQGLIGMLTSAALSWAYPTCDVIGIDVSEERLYFARMFMKFCQHDLSSNHYFDTFNPLPVKNGSSSSLEADYAIEVSGNVAGLNTALQHVRSSGSVIVGSWYDGKGASSLKLGTKFHRSSISLVTSQVSSIPGHFSDRWDKTRRFSLTWKAIREIKPSRILKLVSPTGFNQKYYDMTSPKDVSAAYDALEKGKFITAMFFNPFGQ